MFRTDLSNGITVLYNSDTNGKLVLRHPDGSQVQTTWSQLGLMKSLVESLREAYEYLLLRAADEKAESAPPVEKLVQLDDLLFALGTENRRLADAESLATD